MKTYSNQLIRFKVLSISVFMLCTMNASASTNVEILVSMEETSLSDLPTTPPTSLQIVSITPFTYNGGVNIRCWGQNSGRSTVIVAGGLAPYSYQWSGLPYQTGATAYGMSAGSYTVTVTDALGISVSGSVTLIQNPPLQAIATSLPILCNGGVTTVFVSATGGTLPYSGINWYDVTPGLYDYTVADANGCRNKVYTAITEPPVFQAVSNASPILCNGDLSNVVVEGFGGTAPYSGTGLFDEAAGMTYYTITDANGCFAYTSVFINQPQELVADISNTSILCRGGHSQITVSGLGGTTPYTGTGVYTQSAGTYQYTVVDGNGCQSTASIAIAQPMALVATISSTPIACHGGLSNVEVVATGGVSPYIGPGIFSEQSGLHIYTVTDANGCSVDISTIILQPREIELDISWLPIESPGGTTNVEVLASGGTPSYIGTGVFSVSAGTYFYTVNDANGCSITQSITVTRAGTSAFDIVGTNSNQNGFVKSNTINNENRSFVRAAFNSSSEEMEITYRLNYDSKVSIEIYDMTGALVEMIQEDMAVEGENYTVSIESGKLTAGVYIYQFVTDAERQIDKLQIIR